MISFEQVSKTYIAPFRRTRVEALSAVSLTVGRGEVVGIAGPNGAGKSTLLSLLLGYLNPTSGSVRIDGQSARSFVEKNGIGYLPELMVLPPRWTVAGALRRLATLDGLDRRARREQIGGLIERLGLEEYRSRQVRKLSKGTLQRLGLAQAMLADRDLMILDEPTHGLDPLWTQSFREIVSELRHPGRAILVASHNLDELERIADRVVILHRGRLERIVGRGKPSTGGTWRLVLREPQTALTESRPELVPVNGRSGEYRVEGDAEMVNSLLSTLIASGAVVAAFYPEHSRLETEFRQAVGGDSES